MHTAQSTKIGGKNAISKVQKTFLAISKMAKNQFFAPEKSLKLPKMQFSDFFLVKIDFLALLK